MGDSGQQPFGGRGRQEVGRKTKPSAKEGAHIRGRRREEVPRSGTWTARRCPRRFCALEVGAEIVACVGPVCPPRVQQGRCFGHAGESMGCAYN